MSRVRVHYLVSEKGHYRSDFYGVDLLMFRPMTDIAWKVPKHSRMLWVNPDKALAIEMEPAEGDLAEEERAL